MHGQVSLSVVLLREGFVAHTALVRSGVRAVVSIERSQIHKRLLAAERAAERPEAGV